MPTIVTKAGKASALTHAEMDANFKIQTTNKVAGYTITAADNRDTIEFTTAGVTLTLTDASTLLASADVDTGDFQVTIKNMASTGNITIDCATPVETIDGSGTNLTLLPYECITLKCGSVADTWMVIDRYYSPSYRSGFKNITFSAEYDHGNSGASPTINWTNGQKQKVTLSTSPVAFAAFTAPTSGIGSFQLKVVQDGTGSRTATWTGVKWPAGTAPTLTTAAAGIDIISFYYDGTSWYGVASIGFA